MNKQYLNVEQRMIATYKDTFPPFYPLLKAEVSVNSQKNYYELMDQLYQLLFEQPQLLFATLHSDDTYTRRFNKASENKPKLRQMMKSALDGVDSFLRIMMEMMQQGHMDGEVLVISKQFKIKKTHIGVLNGLKISCIDKGDERCFDLSNHIQAAQTWHWMATRPNADLLNFSRCMFDSEHSYASDIFASLLGDEAAFHELESFFVKNGYVRIDNRDNQISLDYVKEYAKKPTPVKDSWAERTHGGFSAKLDLLVDIPQFFSLRVPMLKQLLERANEADSSVRQFIINSNKKCDGCRYCVQTDKSGTRPLAYVTMEQDKSYHLCPLFAGFCYCWDQLNAPLAQNMIGYLQFINHICSDKEQK